MCGAPTDRQDAATAALPGEPAAWLGAEDTGTTVEPIDRLVDLRREIIRLSAALRRLSDEDYAAQSPAAIDVRDRLATALDDLDLLPLDGEFGEVRDYVAAAARHLLQAFDVMMQLSWPGATLDEATRAEAQSEVGEATRALRTAGDLLAALFGEEAVADDGLDEDVAAAPPEAEAPSEPRPLAMESFAMQFGSLPAEDESPPAVEGRDWLAPGSEEPPRPAPAPQSVAERAQAGDPLGEALEWEVLNRWAQHRVEFYRKVDEVVQHALHDAVQATLDMRARTQRDAELHVERLHQQRRALLDEIETLRQERERLRDETAQLRIELERLEHARTNTESEAQQMLRDARVQRARLLGEIETLTKQLAELHRTVQSLPGFERGAGPAGRRSAPLGEAPGRPTRADDAIDGRRQPLPRGEEPQAGPADLVPDALADALASGGTTGEAFMGADVVAEAAGAPLRPPAAPPARPAARPPAPAPEGPPSPRAEVAPPQRPTVAPRQRPVLEPPPPPEPGEADQALADLLRDFQPSAEVPATLGDLGSDEGRAAPSADESASTAPAGREETTSTEAPPVAAASGPQTTEIRITGQNVIRQRPQFWMAVKGLEGVRSVLPRVEEGALVLRAQHERGPDLIEDLVNLPGMNLKLVSASFPERIELSI
jgi:TolA-binding protein